MHGGWAGAGDTKQDLGISKLLHAKASFLGNAKYKLPKRRKVRGTLLLNCSYSHIPVPKVIVFSSPPPEGVRKAVDLPKLRHGQSTYTTKELFIWKTENKAEESTLKITPGQGAA